MASALERIQIDVTCELAAVGTDVKVVVANAVTAGEFDFTNSTDAVDDARDGLPDVKSRRR